MNLFDPLRPKLPNSRPTWLRNHIAIPHFEIFPLPNEKIELSLWLPIRDSTFASKRFTKTVLLGELIPILTNFSLDPETTCEELFPQDKNDLSSPELRKNIRIERNYEIVSNEKETSSSVPKQKQKKSLIPMEF